MLTLSGIVPWTLFEFGEPLSQSLFSPVVISDTITGAETAASALSVSLVDAYVHFGIYVSRPAISVWLDFDSLSYHLQRLQRSDFYGYTGATPIYAVPIFWQRVVWRPAAGKYVRGSNSSIDLLAPWEKAVYS